MLELNRTRNTHRHPTIKRSRVLRLQDGVLSAEA